MKSPLEQADNIALSFEAAMRDINVSSPYSSSVFTLEINGTPTLAFRLKWHAEADRLGHDWVYSHKDQISTKGPYGTELPPIIKVRTARAIERAAFEAATGPAEIYDGVKIVRLSPAAPS